MVRCVFILLLLVAMATPRNVIRIGAFFNFADHGQRSSLYQAFEEVKSEGDIFGRPKIDSQIWMEDENAIFNVSAHVCSFLPNSVAAIFNFHSAGAIDSVASICQLKEIPHLVAHLDLRPPKTSDWTINLYPHKDTLSQAYGDALRSMGWNRFLIIYEKKFGLSRVERLLQMGEFSISLQDVDDSSDYRAILGKIQKTGVTNIVLDVETKNLKKILQRALDVGLMTPYSSFFVTSLDTHMVDLQDIQLEGSTVTAMRLFNPHDEDVRNLVDSISTNYGFTSPILTTKAVLTYDAIYLFANAVKEIERSMEVRTQPLHCDTVGFWNQGAAVVNYIQKTEFEGLSGQVKFDAEGFRREVTLEVIETKKGSFTKTGTWNSSKGIKYLDGRQPERNGPKARTLVVSTILNAPYAMLREGAETTTGNDRFEGFCIDLLAELAKILDFEYTIIPAPDSRYGSRDPVSGRWNGMIGELIERRADMAIADITITSKREKVVDFTSPWMNVGISILYKKARRMTSPAMFQFIAPFSLGLWLCIIASYLGLFLLLAVFSRFYPQDYKRNRGEGNPCFYFFTLPKIRTYAASFVKGIILVFTLFLMAIYTSNVGKFLAIYPTTRTIESAEDLARQTAVKYGVTKGGSTYSFFRDSNTPTYRRMFEAMEKDHSVYTTSPASGVERVLQMGEDYAFLMESSSIEYVTQRQCELVQLGGVLNSRYFGIAVPPGSPFKDALSRALLELTERGSLEVLHTKWWKMKNGGGRCIGESDSNLGNDGWLAIELGIENVRGLFILLLVGIAIASVIAVAEYLIRNIVSKPRGGNVEEKPE